MTDLDYGDMVVIEKGAHKGKTALYDNDEDGCLICYTKYFPDAEYVLVRRSSVRIATKEEAAEWWNPELKHERYRKIVQLLDLPSSTPHGA
jgi:hypothetical protein